MLPLRDTKPRVVGGDDAGLTDLLGPPAWMFHGVLQGAGGQALGLPALGQGVHVFALE